MANPDLINVTSVLGGNAGFNLTNTATATLITVDAEHICKINRITVANVDGTNSATFDLFVDGLGTGASGVNRLMSPYIKTSLQLSPTINTFFTKTPPNPQTQQLDNLFYNPFYHLLILVVYF